MQDLRPFIKWAGGKTQLLPTLTALMPKSYNRYFEPFLGGGAMLFHLHPEHAYASDINPVLVQTYIDIKERPRELMQMLACIDKLLKVPTLGMADKNDYYIEIRKEYNKLLRKKEYGLQSSALLLFLNKHCFNGLYRTNRKGEFNAPFAYTSRSSFKEENIAAVSKFLKQNSVHLCAQDFAYTCELAEKGDFVFIDSPYAPLTDTSFVGYTQYGFPASEHVRLALIVREMAARGVMVMVTNHNTPFIHELYSDFFFLTVPVHRNINRNGNSRYGEEVIITTYKK